MASIIVNDMLPILESEDDVTDLEVDEKAQFLLDTPKSDISESLWNLFKDVWRFLSYEELPSVRADKEGLQIGDFLLKHADIAGEMEEVRSDLEKSINIPEIKIEVTYFKNWAGTQTRGLLLYAKPETVHHVIAIVKAAKDKSLKVSQS